MDPDPGRGGLLFRAATRALAAMGAEVRVFANAENCVRPREPVEAGGPPFVIEVEGLPNLLHELAHVVLLGRVEKDHATPYARIPFDLASPDGRRLLFEELACCLASCAWHPGSDADAQAWFAEQVGIQDVFFGFDGDPAGFLAAADARIRAHGAELSEAIARAAAGIQLVLERSGAPLVVARPRREASIAAFMRAWHASRPRPAA